MKDYTSKKRFVEFAHEHGAKINREQTDHAGEVVKAKFSREDSIAFSDGRLDVMSEQDGQMISTGPVYIKDFALGVLIAEKGQEGPDMDECDYRIEVVEDQDRDTSYPNGSVTFQKL